MAAQPQVQVIARLPGLFWCSCNHCQDMPSDDERLCCGFGVNDCLSRHPTLENIVDPVALGLQRALWQELMVVEAHADEPGAHNRQCRHTAYRCYVLWQHGRLGAGNRRVIPSCVVTRIRQLFPSPNGHYTGYRPGRFV
ncbi:P2X purinoceptor 7-like [Diadema antillarum]|uniref:P2X purinoceptor 7-like n=1 Tax=Diadema antillarum TaxID=105358 RepID=UPI003A8593AA